MEENQDTHLARGRLPGDLRVRRIGRHARTLRRALGVPGLFSMIYANVGSSIYYALGVTALYALGATPIVFFLAGIFFIFTALSYVEGTAAIPEAGGASSFARHGFNEFWSFFAGWAQILGYIVTISISAYTAVGYVGFFFPALENRFYHVALTAFIILALMVLNVRGVRESSNFNVGITMFDLGTQIVLVILGIFFLLNIKTLVSQVQWGVAPTWNQFIFSISIVMIAFTGIETTSNMAEEARDATRSIPRAIFWCVAFVLILFVGISSISLSAMPVKFVDGHWTTDLATKWINDPVAGIAASLPIASKFVSFWVALLATTILIIATNAAIMGISRLTYSMGHYQQLPPILSRVHKKFRTPHVAIIVFCILGILLIIPADIPKLADAYSFGAMLSYTIANLSILALRIRDPKMKRPYKISLNIKIKGRELPITSILGVITTFTVWIIVAVTHYYGRLIGIPFMIFGILLYLWYRKSRGLPIFETVKADKSKIY
ncbi:MAG: APC family permease [Candidatus Eremiobacteraeota bacterium]|nr:APC family permease [Candidatus Eremiobacteraeota bacterium]